MKDNSQLVPGQLYKITDYICTTSQENTTTACKQFDIIVRALSNNALSEEAFAAHCTVEAGTPQDFRRAKMQAWKI